MLKYDTSFFKEKNDIQRPIDLLYILKGYARQVGLTNKDIIESIDFGKIFRILDEPRTIVIAWDEKSERIYISPSRNDNVGYTITFTNKLCEFGTIVYDRIGNGIVQQGTAYYEQYKDGVPIGHEQYVMQLKLSNNPEQATLTLFEKEENFNETALQLNINPRTLLGIEDSDENLLRPLINNHSLDCFRIHHLQGINHINGNEIDYIDTDCRSFNTPPVSSPKTNRL